MRRGRRGPSDDRPVGGVGDPKGNGDGPLSLPGKSLRLV